MTLLIANRDWVLFNENFPEWSKQINFWKTKEVYRLPSWLFALVHKWVLTAFDDPKFTWECVDKAVTSTYSSAVLFKRIEATGVSTTHKGILNSNTSLETPLDMLPFELIWRRYNVDGNSWAKRHPWNKYKIWEKYDDIIYEACLKWSVITSQWEQINDPFLVLDENFKPLLRADRLPRLTHSKTGQELEYTSVVHPNKGWEIAKDEVVDALSRFSMRSEEIRKMLATVQQVTFDTYAEIGRVNADGKIEVGVDNLARLTLWDEIDLDTVRNMDLKKIEINGETYEFPEDSLWTNLADVLWKTPQAITRIIEARHSGKQFYRDLVKLKKNELFDGVRKTYNKWAAEETTHKVYIPIVQALSNRFGKEVWLVLLKE